MPSEDEIKRITELHDKGLSQGQIAKEMGRSKSTINGWLKSIFGESFAPNERTIEQKKEQTKNATTYNLQKRLELNDKFFKKLNTFVDSDKITPRDYKDLMVAYGILEDKRQLLEPIKPEQAKTKLDALIELMENDSVSPPKTEGGIS